MRDRAASSCQRRRRAAGSTSLSNAVQLTAVLVYARCSTAYAVACGHGRMAHWGARGELSCTREEQTGVYGCVYCEP